MALDSFAASPGHTTLSCRLQREPLSIYEFRTDPLPTSAQSQTLGGCGAQVHMRASYAVRHWCGDEDAISPTVVPLETRYFSQEQRAALTRGRRCGCRLEGVGCAVCGNPLGAQHSLQHDSPRALTSKMPTCSSPVPFPHIYRACVCPRKLNAQPYWPRQRPIVPARIARG
ncbi:hypothetical protein B0H13DRAFT_753882 [Mycena leptocephala]|nr:hypothetical protein B0H13DRAFT_753882 [Mycena leptocephala]